MRDLLSNTPNCYVCAGEFRLYLFTGNAWQNYAKRKGIGAGNPANWLVNSRRTRQTGFCGFDHAITGAIYFTFNNGKKSSVDLTNYTSIQIFHFKIPVKKKNVENKFVLRDKNFFRTFNPIRPLRLRPLEYKYHVIFVLVLGVICTLRSAVG